MSAEIPAADMWYHYKKVGCIDQRLAGRNGVMVLVHLNTTPPNASWHNIGFMLAPKACECGLNQIETYRIPFEDTPFEWKRVTDEYGRWAWYKGVTSPIYAKDMTVLAAGYMLSSSREWDVYVGAGRGITESRDMVYSSATTSEVEFYFPDDDHNGVIVKGEHSTADQDCGNVPRAIDTRTTLDGPTRRLLDVVRLYWPTWDPLHYFNPLSNTRLEANAWLEIEDTEGNMVLFAIVIARTGPRGEQHHATALFVSGHPLNLRVIDIVTYPEGAMIVTMRDRPSSP
ncbi:hypothetical protein FIBSPDRAFT_963437 [Athelia psychrophila]|uniref:Uncharacterized protein n=1 Tax=Athelia psychrophila TaxID=1759441 RepID=A0A165YYJ9_9AGAM|nr:hypothetical protein FIBSPDRAFT_963437 [Fibularhizoctonia sp. CBS 109695]